jgi:hypothetical protein
MSTKASKLYVILAADTEDNHPNYVPGWWRFGSDYDTDPPRLRFDWTKHVEMLWDCFEFDDMRFKVSWFIRSDPAVSDRCMHAMNTLIDRARNAKDELAIHIHTLRRDNHSKWVQCLRQDDCKAVVSESLDLFKEYMGTIPESTRMGWNFMSNSTMQQLETRGVLYDASCIPGMHSQLMYGRRDNFYDWSKAPSSPFNPSYQDYQVPGTMKILEIPVTTYPYKNRNASARNVFPRWMKAVSSLRHVTSVGATVSQFPLLSPARRLLLGNDFLIFSAWRSNADLDNLLLSKLSESRLNGWSYILGCFHPCEVMDPISGKPNLSYLRNLRFALHRITALKDEIDVVPVSVCEFGRAYQRGSLRE